MSKRSPILLFGSFFCALCLDQISKALANDVVLNTGISFGIFQSGFLTLFLVIILIGVAIKFGKVFYLTSAIGTGLFFGASLSNIVDRIVYGGVRDFLPIPIIGVRNNVADWLIMLSLFWLLFGMQSKKVGEKV